MHIQKSTEFLPFALPPARGARGGTKHSWHSPARLLLWVPPFPPKCTEHCCCCFPGIPVPHSCSTHRWAPKPSPATPGAPAGGGSGEGPQRLLPRGRHQDTLQNTQDWNFPPTLSSLCRKETPPMGKASHVLLLLVLWGKGPFPQLHSAFLLLNCPASPG